MTKFISSDSDLPESLNTTAKQIAKAKELAGSHLQIRATTARGVDIQGFFSRTLIVTMVGGDKALGDVVPEITEIADEALQREEIWPYYMSFVPGPTWRRSPAFVNSALNAACIKSLRCILSRGFIAHDSTTIVEEVIMPKLKALQTAMIDETNSPRPDQIKPFQNDIERLIESSDQLKRLPLFISHADLNHMNVLVWDVGKVGEVSGIVDWELSSDLPFGMGFCRIHDLIGRFTNGEFRMLEGFEDAERGFWEAVFNGIPQDVRRLLDANLDAVQTSVRIWSLLHTLDIEGEKFNSAGLKALPKFLTYRIPALRGQEPPYTK